MATNTTYQIGQQITWTGEFKNNAGTLADPDDVTFVWRTPAGVETSYTYGDDAQVTKTATGVYEFESPTVTVAGQHVCRVKSVDGFATATETAVSVRASKFTTP